MKRLLFSFCLVAALVLLSYGYVDRPVVDFLARHHSRDLVWVPKVFEGVYAVILGGALLTCLQSGVAIACDRRDWLRPAIYLPAVAVAFAFFMKDIIKREAGRAWPATFVCQNPSYLHDHVYGFFGAVKGVLNASFPSGHAMVSAAAMTVFAVLYPRYKVIFASVALAMGVSMVWMYYHFVSDVLAGWYIGALIGIALARIHVMRQEKC